MNKGFQAQIKMKNNFEEGINTLLPSKKVLLPA
jgi:hypothetical protein